MNEYVLIAVVGKTDPIRGQHDGPILHIVRHYEPKKVVLLLSEEIGKDEAEYHYNEDAIHLLNPDCQVEILQTGIKNVHSYDDFSLTLLNICNQVGEQYQDKKILLDITSGTPQLETALCMIAMSDPGRYIPVQVFSPERSANKATFFNPREDLIEEWFETDLDNETGISTRCHIPELLNFKRPMVQFQIISLIENYDYAGAYQLYCDNQGIFSERVGDLLQHAKLRLNLEHEKAERFAVKLGLKKELYPVVRSDIAQLVDFFNSMKVKQIRGELNDFSMRMEIMTLYLGRYILENCMRIPLGQITEDRRLRNSTIQYLSKDKCTKRIPGIEEYLDEQFSDKKLGAFEWGKPLNALSIVHILSYLSRQDKFERYATAADELKKWSNLSGQVRNPAAHTIVAITDRIIRDSYDNKDSSALCKAIQTIMIQAFGTEAPKEAFDIYETINSFLKNALEK